VGVKLGVSH